MTESTSTSSLIQGATGEWEVVIGMEIHAQITSRSKLFSGASTAFGLAPNNNVSFVDAAMPGMLPVLNEECIWQAIRTGLGLKAKVNPFSIFDRKNYFYPDLPQGYQISQYQSPLIGEGEIRVDVTPHHHIKVGIERLHVEQDAGKSIHDQSATQSFVDLNRSGIGLMEIVSKPDMRSAEEAKAYVSHIRMLLRYLGTCDGDMEKGNLRADVNVSVRKPGTPLGTRCEIKNVNSIRFIGQAIEAEARRQITLLEEGQSIHQETRLFDPGKGETRAMRSKEEAHDYRYFPDPDLPPLIIEEARIEEIRQTLPELPDAKKERFMRDYELSSYDAGILIMERESADFYEAVVQTPTGARRDPKLAANWVINDLFGRLNKEGHTLASSPLTSAQLGLLLDLLSEGTLSGKMAKDLFEIMWNEGGDPRQIVEERGLKQLTNTQALEQIIDEILTNHPEKVTQVKNKPSLLGWFVGQVMKKTAGQAHPQAVNDILKKKLEL